MPYLWLSSFSLFFLFFSFWFSLFERSSEIQLHDRVIKILFIKWFNVRKITQYKRKFLEPSLASKLNFYAVVYGNFTYSWYFNIFAIIPLKLKIYNFKLLNLKILQYHLFVKIFLLNSDRKHENFQDTLHLNLVTLPSDFESCQK